MWFRFFFWIFDIFVLVLIKFLVMNQGVVMLYLRRILFYCILIIEVQLLNFQFFCLVIGRVCLLNDNGEKFIWNVIFKLQVYQFYNFCLIKFYGMFRLVKFLYIIYNWVWKVFLFVCIVQYFFFLQFNNGCKLYWILLLVLGVGSVED